MDSAAFQERVKRLKEVNEVIKDLDPAIREGALPLLAEYVTGHPAVEGAEKQTDNGNSGATLGGAAEFFAKFQEGKPSDNAISIAAYVYSQYGTEPFKLEEISEIARSVGLTIPTSPNMTFNAAQREGKLLFQHSGRGEFKPTVHGELYFKKTYEVAKGTKKRPAEGGES